TFLSENPKIDTPNLHKQLYRACEEILNHEDTFIDLAFEMGNVPGLSAWEVKQYIRYIADRRLTQIGLKPIYNQPINPLPWVDQFMNGLEHANFFENRATEYSRAATQGTWIEAFDDADETQGDAQADSKSLKTA
ncbi:MAG: ribonucleotide-diphosphate reductase subunit beta, partial [Pseudomonadota bacterium]